MNKSEDIAEPLKEEESHPEPGPGGSPPTTTQACTARIEKSSYLLGMEQAKAILDEQAVEQAKDEKVLEAENEELLNEFKEGTEEIDLFHSRIRTLRGFKPHFTRLAPSLKRVNLRQNLIPKLKFAESISTPIRTSISEDPQTADLSKIPTHPNENYEEQNQEEIIISPFDSLEFLEELDLYDNQIGKIEGLGQLHELKTLDLSFNLIRKIENLENLKSLSTLYLIQNKISQIEALEALADKLTSLELGSNRIRQINNLATLTNLTELWLGRNKISKLEGLSTLVNLRSLSIQSNRIIKLEGLENLAQLEELYISHNGLTSIGDGLKENKKLKVLDVGANEIDDLSGVGGLENLEELWANNNKISMSSWNGMSSFLSEKLMPKLQTIYLEGNPVQADMGVNYRRKIILACPQLIQIDATFVKS